MPEEKEQVYSHLARVRLVNSVRMQDLHDMVRDVGGLPESGEFYYFDAEISNDLLDSHFTHMNEKTLSNYAEDANRGVAFLRGHNWHELPLGYSVSAELSSDKGRQRVLAGFYTVRGL